MPRQGSLPTSTFKYDRSISLASKFAQLVRWLADDLYDLVLMYDDEPDNTGHVEGPDSPNVSKVLSAIDFEFGRFIAALRSRSLYDKVLTLLLLLQ